MKEDIKYILKVLILSVVFTFLFTNLIGFNARIPSASMQPTIDIGDRLFVSRIYSFNKLERGDIVVFYSEELNDTLIKRLIGLPNDKIRIMNGVVSVNGETLKEDYIGMTDNFNGEYEVPEGKYFFLGDNRGNSKDSRYWINPYIDEKDIEGKAVFKYYPLNDIHIMR